MYIICCIHAYDAFVIEISHLSDDDDGDDDGNVVVSVSGDAAVCRQLR